MQRGRAQRGIRSPGRGRYDRQLSASGRAREQYGVLLDAVVRVSLDRVPPTVARIVAEAGVGKNTFYEHFNSAEDALESAVQREMEGLARALLAATTPAPSTPGEDARRLAACWLSWCHTGGTALQMLDRFACSSLDATLRDAVHAAHRAFAHAGYAAAHPDELRLVAAVGALRALGKAVARTTLPHNSGAATRDWQATELAAQEALLRLLR